MPAALAKTRQLIEDLGAQVNEAAKASFLGVITGYETGRFGRDDALLQLQLTTMGPAASSDPAKMQSIISSFESETKS